MFAIWIEVGVAGSDFWKSLILNLEYRKYELLPGIVAMYSRFLRDYNWLCFRGSGYKINGDLLLLRQRF